MEGVYMFDIIFVITGIFIGFTFVFVILMFVSPKLRGKLMSRQVKALKHMTDYSKKDFEDINYNVADASMNANKRLMEDNYDDLEDMASMNANINKDAIYIKSKAIKDGLSSSKIYCKYCGNKIDSDSKYCNYCGKKLTK